jgi:hypothetical protein
MSGRAPRVRESSALLRRSLASGLVTLALAGCGGGSGNGGDGAGGPTPGPACIFAQKIDFPAGAVPPGYNTGAVVQVLDNSCNVPNANASVTMNGVALAYSVANQDYEGNVAVAPGGAVSVSVTVGGATYAVSAKQFTSYPAISAPTAGLTLPQNASTFFAAWSGGAPAANASYGLGVLDAANPNGSLVWPISGNLETGPLSMTSFSVSGLNTLGNLLVVVGVTATVDIPGAANGSGMLIGGFNYVPMTVTSNVHSGLSMLESINVTPVSGFIGKGMTQQFTATGSYSDFTTLDLTNSVTWTSQDATKATINSTGLATATWTGLGSITATFGSIGALTPVIVVPGFLPAATYHTSNAVATGDTAIGDLNGDGRNDVAVLEEGSGSRILVYYQNSQGTLDPPQTITTDLIVTGMAIGDVNKDGWTDLVVSGNATTGSAPFGRVAVYRQDSVAHTLGTPQELTLSSYNVGPVAIADLNNDSLPDIVAVGICQSCNGVVSIFFQGAAGTLGPEVAYTSAPVANIGGEVHVADMNHDGLNDIVLQSAGLQFAVIKQVTAGTFSSSPDLYTVQPVVGTSFSSFRLGDLNGDGLVDVAVADQSGNLNIFYQNAQGTLDGPSIFPNHASSEVHIADLDGDGLNDLILVNDGNLVTLLYQATDHSFRPLSLTLPTQSAGGTMVHQAISVGDVTGDGLEDIVVSWMGDEVVFVLPRAP